MGFTRSAAAVYCGILATLRHQAFVNAQGLTCSEAESEALGPDVRDPEAGADCLAGCTANRISVSLSKNDIYLPRGCVAINLYTFCRNRGCYSSFDILND